MCVRAYADTRVHACIHTRMSAACKAPSFSFCVEQSRGGEGGVTPNNKIGMSVERDRCFGQFVKIKPVVAYLPRFRSEDW